MSTDFSDKTALQHLINISIRLTSEENTTRLLEDILQVSMQVAEADAGTIYSITPQGSLKFETLINKSLDMYLGGTKGEAVDFADIPLYQDGKPNESAIVAHAALKGEVINIEDVYDTLPFDLSAARTMDQKTGYRTQSMLTIPLADHTHDIIGVLQLINAQENGNVIPFNHKLETLIRSFASLGAIALTNKALINDMEKLFKAFAQTIARAIDEKSPHTGGHCRRVPELTLMIADALNKAEHGNMANFEMSDAERHELSVAGWLHDCGKIATPEYIMEKPTKLQTIFDRIEHVDAKLEIVKRDIEINYKNKMIQALQDGEFSMVQELEVAMQRELTLIEQERSFLRTTNIGSEFLTDEAQQKVQDISQRYKITIAEKAQDLLTQDEIKNLQIQRGTLTQEEREIIKRHMNVTLDILTSLPFPKHLSNVPEYALGHHETLDGKGYPRGLTKEQMSVPSRLMAIADIYEALSAADRPYKDAKPVSECLTIMGRMVERHHLDPDIFAVFIESGVYKEYILKFAQEAQLDHFELKDIPGYTPTH